MTMFNVYWTFQVGPCEDHDDAFDVTETEIQHCLEADLDAVCRTIGNALDECSMFIMSCSEFRVERRSAEEIEAEIEALHRLSGLLEETGCQTLAELKDRAQREPELRAKAERFMAGDSVQ